MAKRLVLATALMMGVLLILMGKVPELPFFIYGFEENLVTDSRLYITENFWAISFAAFSLAVSIFTFSYGLFLRRYAGRRSRPAAAILGLGTFILLSGVWILTDSQILTVFTTDYGGELHKGTVVFISYISIMLLPILFISFLERMLATNKVREVFSWLLLLNLAAFVTTSFFDFPKPVNFGFLLANHGLIYALMMIEIVRNIRFVLIKKSGIKRDTVRGILIFMLFSGAALVDFFFVTHHRYADIYAVGLAVLIVYMIKATAHNILSMYKENVKLELYKTMAYTDGMTQIKNKNAFAVEQETAPVNENTCYVVMDINGLKRVNDIFGHAQGDMVIRRAAQLIQEEFSEIGSCYRVGGDEFVVVCKNVEETVVQGAIGGLEDREREIHSGTGIDVAIACGYAFGSAEINTSAGLFAAADKAMYRNKKKTRETDSR